MSTQFYFAVQSLAGEPPASFRTAKAILETAKALNIDVDVLESLDDFTVGTHRFVRYRMKADPGALLDALLKSGRGVVGLLGVGKVTLPGGRTGNVSQAMMQSFPRALRTFKGTKSPHWERQFAAA